MAFSQRAYFFGSSPWLEYFKNASELDQPHGLSNPKFSYEDGKYKISSQQWWSKHTPALSTPDRRVAVNYIDTEYPALTSQPPSDYVWPKNGCQEEGKVINHAKFTQSVTRSIVPNRPTGLYFRSCPTNTYYDLGWYAMKGYRPPKPSPPAPGCLPSLLYRDTNFNGSGPSK